MTLVIDASVAVKWFLDEPLQENARQILFRETALHAPDLLIPEVANAVWKRLLRNEIEMPQAQEIMQTVSHPFASLLPSAVLGERALEFACDLQHPAYDCFYLACAEAVEGVVVTADARLLSAVAAGGYDHLVEALDRPDV